MLHYLHCVIFKAYRDMVAFFFFFFFWTSQSKLIRMNTGSGYTNLYLKG